MTALITLGSRTVSHGYRWRDRTGAFHNPSEMVDRHLFYTVRMIWNNFMPAEARVCGQNEQIRLYDFGSFYTRKYLADAICAMVPELEQREARLPQEWRDQLAQMRSWFNCRLDLSKKELGYGQS